MVQDAERYKGEDEEARRKVGSQDPLLCLGQGHAYRDASQGHPVRHIERISSEYSARLDGRLQTALCCCCWSI